MLISIAAIAMHIIMISDMVYNVEVGSSVYKRELSDAIPNFSQGDGINYNYNFATAGYTQSDIAAEMLDGIERQLSIDVNNFIENRNNMEKNLKQEIDTLKKETDHTLDMMKNSSEDKKKHEKWLRTKQRRIKILQNELILLKEITLLVTKLEAAKYQAKARSHYFDETQPVNNPVENMQSTNELNNIIYSYINLKYPQNDAIYMQAPELLNAEDNSYNTLSSISKKDVIRKSLHKLEDLEERMGYNENSIKNLMFVLNNLASSEKESLKKLVNMQKRNYINLLESENGRTAKTNVNQEKNVLSDLENVLKDSESRFNMLRQLEWAITQIEAAKYLAKLELDSEL